MKFGETFMEYLHGDQGWFLEKCSHVEYKKLKKVLKSCRRCKSLGDSTNCEQGHEENHSVSCQCQSCSLCDQMFFSELMKEASDIAGCFSTRVQHLLHLHINKGIQRYMLSVRRCFKNDQQAMAQEGQMLIGYIAMNAVAIRKILKKYDKRVGTFNQFKVELSQVSGYSSSTEQKEIHGSENGKNFNSKLRAERIELLQSPWLIELGAFYLNFTGIDRADFPGHVSCDLDAPRPLMTISLPNSIKLEYDLTCAICLETLFNPYALSCGHLFCKSCACSAASVMIFQGLRAASPDSRCPVCREAGVYDNAVHMLELAMLLKNRGKEYWKERANDERVEMVKQSKIYWDSQTKYMIGY